MLPASSENDWEGPSEMARAAVLKKSFFILFYVDGVWTACVSAYTYVWHAVPTEARRGTGLTDS